MLNQPVKICIYDDIIKKRWQPEKTATFYSVCTEQLVVELLNAADIESVLADTR